VSAHSAGAYTATLLVMVNVMRGGGHAPPPPTLTARTNFTLMTECTPESSVATLCTLWGVHTRRAVGSQFLEDARHRFWPFTV
jgi:hypothetical protein